jgi:hypothetical protein
MSLLAKLRDKQARRIATVTPTTFATQPKIGSQTVANVATVTVADQGDLKTYLRHKSESTRSKVVAHQQSSHISLESKAVRDQEVKSHYSGTSGFTVPVNATVATFATKLSDQELGIYPLQRVATVTVATLATDVETSCTACTYVTKFGNCSMPVKAGLSPTFKLISHPENGRGCVAFSKRLNFFTEEALKQAESALAAGAIDADDAAIAQSAIKAADGDDSLIAEWRSLLNAVILGSRRK